MPVQQIELEEVQMFETSDDALEATVLGWQFFSQYSVATGASGGSACCSSNP
jgi:hypothetical protein